MNRIILLALVTVLLNPLNAQTKKEIDKETALSRRLTQQSNWVASYLRTKGL